MNDQEDPPLTKEEELFGKWFMAVMQSAYPNPDRVGCPDSRIIRNIVFNTETDVKTIRKVVSHMTQCSPCCTDARVFLNEYRQATKK